MDQNHRKLLELVRALPLMEGKNETQLPYLAVYRFEKATIEMPRLEHPYIFVVLDGSVRLYTPSGIMDYVAGQYSVSAIDTPNSGYVLAFSERKDILALTLEFTLNDVVSVVLELEDGSAEKILRGELDEGTMEACDRQVIDGLYRLAAAMKEPVTLGYMGKHLRSEIIFAILCGSGGKQFFQRMTSIQQAEEIYEANSWIKKNFRDSFTVEELAEQRNMSVSLFHRKFKSAVGMGPLQCQKRLRLTEARRLMLYENKNVTEASTDVGYESVSQFTRDYRKMFGTAPKEDSSTLRANRKDQANSV